MARTQTADTMRFLGFDGGCVTCSGLAARMEKLTAGKIGFRSLRDAEVQTWRLQALGSAAPFQPTFFVVSGDQIRAWTGFALAWQLVLAVGPITAWRMLRAVGEIAGGTNVQPSNPQRRRFFRATATGAVASALILSGRQPLVSAAASTSNPDAKPTFDLGGVKIKSQRELTGAERDHLLQDLLNNRIALKDVVNTSGKASVLKNGRAVWSDLEDGNRLLSTTWEVNGTSEVLAYYELEKPVKGLRYSHALLYEVEGSHATLILSNRGGLRGVTGKQQPTVQPNFEICVSCTYQGRTLITECRAFDTNCIAGVCATCFYACAAGPVSCASCLFLYCPGVSFFACCTDRFTGCTDC